MYPTLIDLSANTQIYVQSYPTPKSGHKGREQGLYLQRGRVPGSKCLPRPTVWLKGRREGPFLERKKPRNKI